MGTGDEKPPAGVPWDDWARGRITVLNEEVGRLTGERDAALKEAVDYRKTAEGLEYVVRRYRESSVEALDVGRRVYLYHPRGPGGKVEVTVEQVLIDRGGLRYRVRYANPDGIGWVGVWAPKDHVEDAEGLPLPGRAGCG